MKRIFSGFTLPLLFGAYALAKFNFEFLAQLMHLRKQQRHFLAHIMKVVAHLEIINQQFRRLACKLLVNFPALALGRFIPIIVNTGSSINNAALLRP